MIQCFLFLTQRYGKSLVTFGVTLCIIFISVAIAIADSWIFDRSFYPSVYLSTLIPLITAPPIIYFLISVALKMDRAESEVKSIIENAGDAFFIYDQEGNLMEANEAACDSLGYSLDELLALKISDIEIGYDAALLIKQWGELDDGKALTIEGKHKRKNSSEIPVESRINLFSYAGETKILSLSRDVTQRRLADEQTLSNHDQLAHVSRIASMGEMATGIAHELNQPLAAISAYIDGSVRHLESGNRSTESVIDALEKASEQAIRAGEVIRHLRDFVRRKDQKYELVDLHDTIKSAVKMINLDLDLKQVSINFNLANKKWFVSGDPILIQQVVLNLVRNSVDAMLAQQMGPKELNIKSEVANEVITIEFKDNGPGVSADLHEQLFEPYFSTKDSGLGLGLPICRSIMNDHDGNIWHDPSYSLGAAFYLEFPIAENKPANT